MTAELQPYEIYAIKYAERDAVQAQNFIFSDSHDVPMPLDYFVWAIVGNGRTIVVDTGFDAAEAKKRGRTHLRGPDEALRHVGIEAAKVEQLIVTHMHYDHCGNLEMFPNAMIHLQNREMAFATGRFMREPMLRHSFAVDYVTDLVRALYDDRLTFIDGVGEIAPGITLHHIGGHTDGLQAVRVWTKRGWVVLASDASHFYANMERGNPFPVVFNVGEMLAGHRTLGKLAESPRHIIPGHDPLVMKRYPSAARETEGIAIRIDGDPLNWD